MASRWFIYLGSGFIFALIDWHLPMLFVNIPYNSLLAWLPYAIWTLPALGVALVETRLSRQPRLSALATTLFWVAAMITFYGYYMLLAALGTIPQVTLGLIWRSVMRDLVFWSAVSLVVGPILGWSVAALVNRWQRTRQSPSVRGHS